MFNLGSFLNSAIGKSTQSQVPPLPKMTNSDALGLLSSAVGVLGNKGTKASPLSGGAQAGLGLMETGFKAAENIPVVGQFIKAGNIANSLMPDALAGQSKADQFVNKVPGLKVLNFSVGKSKDFSLDPTVSSSGYKGTASQLQNTKDQYAGINQGALTSLFGGKKKSNRQVEAAKQKQNRVSNVLEKGQLALDAQAGISQDLTQQNKLKFAGGFNPIAVGKEGLKLTAKDKKLAQKVKKVIPIKYSLDGFDSDFEQFRKSLPSNLQDTSSYRLKRLWELSDKPKAFDPISGIFTKQKDGWHAPSVAYNKNTNNYEFLKPKTHPTVNLELDWFNSDDAKDFKNEGWQLEDNPDLDYYQYKNIKKFKNGGKIEKSVIPGGALHAHRHHLEDHSEEIANAVTDKGVPVVTFEEGGKINQHAEIERGEIIFRLEIAKKLEELWKDGSEEAMIEAGKLIANEVLNNTKDNSEEYEIDN